MWMNLVIFIYICSFRPFVTREKNRIEIFNEIFICIVTGHALFFTDIVPTRSQRFQVGWSMILFMVVNAAFNLSTVLKLLIRNLYLIYLKIYRTLRRCCDKNFGREVV